MKRVQNYETGQGTVVLSDTRSLQTGQGAVVLSDTRSLQHEPATAGTSVAAGGGVQS